MVFLEKQGRDLSPILQSVDIPEEFLRDPACWLEAHRMEDFIQQIDQAFLDLPDRFVRDIGRNSEQLRSWGVLDSVLKMMESPLDIFNQPNRFISYFISPEPPVAGWKHVENKMTFHVPVEPSEYPHITQYLMGAFEGLPLYMRQSPAHVEWTGSCISILWSENQANLLPAEDLEVRQFNPEWVRTVMESLEQHQKMLENRQQSAQQEVSSHLVLQEFTAKHAQQMEATLQDIIAIKDDFLKLHDYFARSQQLVTFLVHSGRKTKQVDEAMRRMDWSHVQESYSLMVQSACDRILAAKDRAQDIATAFKVTGQVSSSATSAQATSLTDDQQPLPSNGLDNLELPIHP